MWCLIPLWIPVRSYKGEQMDEAAKEIEKLYELELSQFSIYSVSTNRRFPALICDDERIYARFSFFFCSAMTEELERMKKAIRRKTEINQKQSVFLFVIAYPGGASGVNRDLLSFVNDQVTLIDATAVPMESSVRERFARRMAQYAFRSSRHDEDAESDWDLAYEVMKEWTALVKKSPATVYDPAHPKGCGYGSLSLFYEKVLADIRLKYPHSPDFYGLSGFFYSPRLSKYYVKDGFFGKRMNAWETADGELTPETLEGFAPEEPAGCAPEGNDSDREGSAQMNESFRLLREHFESCLSDELSTHGRVSFQTLFDRLQEPPFGVLPNIIGAILTGFLFRPLKDRRLQWTNGFQQDVLDAEHILSMLESGICERATPHHNVLTDSIVLPDERYDAYLHGVTFVFDLSPDENRYPSDTVQGIRKKLETLPFPAVSFFYTDCSENDKAVFRHLLQLITAASDETDKGETGAILTCLCGAFQSDDALAARLKDALGEDSGKKAFVRMLAENGVNDPEKASAALSAMLDRFPARKWIWKEESIILEAKTLE